MASLCVSVCPGTHAALERRPRLEWSSWCPCLWGDGGEGFSLLFPLLVLVVPDFAVGSLASYQILLGDIVWTPVYLPRVFFSVSFKLLQLEEPRTNVKIAQ